MGEGHRQRNQFGLALRLGFVLCACASLTSCGAGFVLAALGISDLTSNKQSVDTPPQITELNIHPLDTPERIAIEFRIKNEDAGQLSARVEYVKLGEDLTASAAAATATPVPGASLPENIKSGERVQLVWDAKRDLAGASALVNLIVTPLEDGTAGEPFRSSAVRAGNTPVALRNARLASQGNRLEVLFDVVDRESDRAMLEEVTVQVAGESAPISVPLDRVDRRDFPGSPEGEGAAFGFDVAQLGNAALAAPGFVGDIIVRFAVQDFPSTIKATGSASLRFDNNEPPFSELLEVPKTDLSRGVVRLRYRLYDRELNRASVQILVDVGKGFEPAAPYLPGRSSGVENLATLSPEVFGEENQPFHTFLWDAMVQASAATSFRWKLIPQDLETGPEGVSPDIVGSFIPRFGLPRSFKVGGGAAYMSTGDYNHDGFTDAVVSDYQTGELTFFQGTADGIAWVAELPCGSGAFTPVSADFNRDGYDDVAVANSLDNSVTYFPGGPGGLKQGVRIEAGEGTTFAIVGDFDGDGYPDAAFPNEAGANVTCLRGGPDGLSRAPIGEIATGPGSYGGGAADFNRDGFDDLLVTNGSALFGGPTVTYLRGGPSGLARVRDIRVGNEPTKVAIGDFDLDGFPDALLSHWSDTFVTYFRGGPDGLVDEPGRRQDIHLFDNPGSVDEFYQVGLAVGDFNGDHVIDAAVTGGKEGLSYVLFGGKEGLTVSSPIQTGSTVACCPAVADFDGDGYDDVFMANWSFNGASYLRGGPDGLRPVEDLVLGALSFYQVAGDFNGDGVPEVLVPDFDGDRVFLLSPNFGGPLQDARVDIGPFATVLDTFDVDGDGFCDVTVLESRSESMSILRGSMLGIQPSQTITLGTGPRAIIQGDFEGDGTLEAVAINEFSDSLTLLRRGESGLSAVQELKLEAGSAPFAGTSGDFDADGLLDLAVANVGSSSVAFCRGGPGGLAFARAVPAGKTPVALRAGDFNGDGIQDLAVANRGSNNITVLSGSRPLGLSDANRQDVPVGLSPAAMEAGDFDADGRIDVAVVNEGSNSCSLMHGTSSGLVLWNEVPVGSLPTHLAAGDFDGDGLLDLVVANSRSESVSVLRGGSSGLTPFQQIQVRGIPAEMLTGDFNGDGAIDCIVRNEVGAAATLLLGGVLGLRRGGNLTVGGSWRAMQSGDVDGDRLPEVLVASLSPEIPGVLPGSLTTLIQALFAPRVNVALEATNPTDPLQQVSDPGGNFRIEFSPGAFDRQLRLFASATVPFPLPHGEARLFNIVSEAVQILPTESRLGAPASLTIKLRDRDPAFLDRILGRFADLHFFWSNSSTVLGREIGAVESNLQLTDLSGAPAVRFSIDRFGIYLVAFEMAR
jgi:VCBS repeat protein